MPKGYEIHVISNTHWDREWLYDFQETRMMLVEFFDRLLDILDHEPRYRAFLLDSQTVPIEDYLEVRPEARDRIRKQVSSGRLCVGPWYTCPEGFIVGGESLVRNLTYGHKVAGEYGKVMKVGHTPFSYGQNSQMPQIYAGFGIDSILFYHGVSHDEVANEFIFEGADGTRLFASQMSSFARYNYYFAVFRPVLYGTSIDERVHEWRKGGLPFHLCGENSCMGHHYLLDAGRGLDTSHLKGLLETLRDKETRTETTRYLAFMMGHDSSLPDQAEMHIIAEGQKHLPNDRLIHSSLPDLVSKVKKAARNLTVLKGERRVPKMMSGRLHLYSDVLSSRTRVKQLNTLTELALQRRAEPMAAIAWLMGAEYPNQLLDIAWKNLLQSHAHDSIAGSGVDDIERDVTHRLRQAMNISKGIARRGMEAIQVHIDNSGAGLDDVLLTVFNPSPFPRTEVLTAVVDLPRASGLAKFHLKRASTGEEQAVQLSIRKPHHSVVNHADDAPCMMATERVRIHLEAKSVPALGYTTYAFEQGGDFLRGGLVSGLNTLENEHLRVQIRADGTLDVLHKETKRQFTGLHYFEDGGEAGHAWMHIEPAADRILTSHGFPVGIALEENGPLLARFRVEYQMRIPCGLEENGSDPWQRLDGVGSASSRSNEARALTIVSWITLRKGARCVEVTTRFENRSDNHRLRVLFPTRLPAKTCFAESAFDVVERPVVHRPDSPWYGGVNATFPMQRFIDVNDGKAGLAVIVDGLREYQVSPDPDRAIALTLLRAFEVSLTTVSKRWEAHPEMRLSQSPGEHEFRYWICPHASGWERGDVLAEVERFSVPLEPAQAGAHGGDLPQELSFMGVEPGNLVVTAIKRAEDGSGLVVRFFNPTRKAISGKIKTCRPIRSAHLLNLEERVVEKLSPQGKMLSLKSGAKKILTVKLVL